MLLLNKEKQGRKIIAVCGKGGAGKTAVSAMMAGAVRRLDPSSRTLLIDADPAGGLAFAMGVEVRKTVGEVREDVIRQARKRDPEIKERIANSIDYYVLEALVERSGWSLLPMGRGESAGCFCPVNSLLREAIKALAGDFDRIIIDGEAGVEQIMRQVMRSVDTLLVVSDLSVRGLNTVSIIKNLLKDKRVLLDPEIMLIINRVKDDSRALESAGRVGFEPAALVPEDPIVIEWDAQSKPLGEIPSETPSMKAVEKLVTRLFFDTEIAAVGK